MTTTWQYRADAGFSGASVIDYTVYAADGEIGVVAEESTDVTNAHIVVDIGNWLFDKKRLVPAGAIERVDHPRELLFIELTKDEVKDAPDFVPESRTDVDARSTIETYYTPWMGVR